MNDAWKGCHFSIDKGLCIGYEAISRPLKGTCSRGTPEYGASAVPAGGFALRTRAASADTPVRHYDRYCGATRWTEWTGQMQVTPDDAGSQEVRAEAERRRSFAAASAAAERRQASAPVIARPRPERKARGNARFSVAWNQTVAPISAPPPQLFEGGDYERRER